jgi:Sulfotransferase domain
MPSASGEVLDLQEPLSVQNRQTILPRRAKHWYSYIPAANEQQYLPWYSDALEYRIHPIHDIRRARVVSPRDRFRIIAKWMRMTGCAPQESTDPLQGSVRRLLCALVHIETPVQGGDQHSASGRCGQQLEQLGYTFDFRDLLEHETLMRDRLGPYRVEMQAACEAPYDVIGQGCLLWRMIYGFVAGDAADDDHVRLARHEDLSSDPVRKYEELYDLLGLDLNEAARRTIAHFTSEENPREVSLRRYGSVPLDSRTSIYSWERRLTSAEIERIRRETQDVWPKFYTERDWDVQPHSRS